MSTLTFDTLKFVERLEKAGATRELASALVDVQRETIAEAMGSTLATKTDINLIRQDVVALEAKMDKTNAELMGEMKLNRWMLGSMLGIGIAILFKLFH